MHALHMCVQVLHPEAGTGCHLLLLSTWLLLWGQGLSLCLELHKSRGKLQEPSVMALPCSDFRPSCMTRFLCGLWGSELGSSQALDPLSCLPCTHHLLFWYISSVLRSLSTRNSELTGVLYFCLLCLASRPPDSPSPLLFPKHMEHGPLTSCSFFAVSPLHYPRIHIPEARTVSTPSPFLNQMPSAKHCAEVGLPAQKTGSVLQDRSGQTQPALISSWQRTPTCW